MLEQGLGLKLGEEMQRRVFDRFGMRNTSMMWRPDFADNLADGWKADGTVEPHDERSKVRAAGSMDTTIADFAQVRGGFMRGEGLQPTAAREMLSGAAADHHALAISEPGARSAGRPSAGPISPRGLA